MSILRPSVIAALLVSAAAAPTLAEEERTAWRLFVSDHRDGVVSVVDPQGRETLVMLRVDGPAALHRSTSGETVFAVQGKAGRVAAVASGIAFDDHGDHGDIEIGEQMLAYGGGQLCTAVAAAPGTDVALAGFRDGAVLAGLIGGGEDVAIRGSAGAAVTAMAVTAEGWLFVGDAAGGVLWTRLRPEVARSAGGG